VGRNLYLINIYKFVVKRKPVMGFGRQGHDGDRLRRERLRMAKQKD
jgi:hypothetical protein